MIFDGPEDAPVRLILAHGAGGPMFTPFMKQMAEGIAAHGVRVARFNFPYMEAKKKVPDREPVLRKAWHDAIESVGRDRPLFIGGKSLGGRIASLIADEEDVTGLVCLGYPFHPPNKPQQLRTAHLENIRTPTLIVQGTRDPFGRREEVEGYKLSDAIRFVWIEGGDHSLKPAPMATAIEAVAQLIRDK